MFFLRSIDLIALVALFVQGFVAWIFVAILATARSRGRGSEAFRDYLRAFIALALALTCVGIRFARTHDEQVADVWLDGRAPATIAYVGYLAMKALFALFLVRGTFASVPATAPAWLARAWWPTVLLFSSLPLVIADVNLLLLAQAPLMVAAAVAGWTALRGASPPSDAVRLVRAGLAGLLFSWTIHAAAVACLATIPVARYVLALNSMIDLAVQMLLGTGVVLSVLEEAHRRTRAAELAREQLQRTLDRDERLRALGTLVSGVAHELNNPLTVILGYCDLLSDSQDPESPARIVGEQAQRCRGIVRDLSALAGQTRQHHEQLDAREVAARIVRGIAPTAVAAGRRVIVDVPERLGFVADRVGIEQVLTNLVMNALQASPPADVVQLRAEPVAAGGIAWEVIDAGPGVPDELREKLFEPFFTTKGPGQGTGLGLAIVQAIVRSHGGTVAVDAAPGGRGARFRVVLPAGSVGDGRAPTVAASAAGRRLLVIDDDEGVRTVVARQAQRRGWEVVEAANAEAALRAIGAEARIDAIVCDVRMPGIGGAGFHDRAARERPELLDRTVFVTADLASDEASRFAQRCRRPLVQKPFDYDELFAVLMESSGSVRAS